MQDTHSILIVEDDETLRQALAEKFTHEGFTVWEAHDGLEGFKMIEEHLPDAIILDLVMPDGPGADMLRRLRIEMPSFESPIVVLTNSNDSDTIADVMQHNVTTYLIKADHSLSDIVTLVSKMLES